MISTVLSNVFNKINKWQQKDENAQPFFFVAATLTGIMCGALAALLKWGIVFVMNTILSQSHLNAGNWEFLLLPVVGIILAATFTRYIVRRPLDHATERVAESLATGDPRLSGRIVPGSVLACSLTLGMGGSAGGEGPIAYTGAAMGNNVGRVFKRTNDDILQMTGCGAAAGIAGIYMAPIGGMMYALEVLSMKQDLRSVLGLTFSCLASALTCYLLMGSHYDVTFMPQMVFENSLIPYVLLLGVLCGIYSVYYSSILARCSKLFGRISGLWTKAFIGGAIIAGLLYLFPSLYGEGYLLLSHLMAGEGRSIVSYSPLYDLSADRVAIMVLFLALLLIKPVATGATNDSGGVGGDFTPTLFCGGVAGYLFVELLDFCFGLSLPHALFTFFGMAAVMAGGKRAPLMGIFITSEMTGLYGFILPLTIVAITSYVTVFICRKGQS